MKAQRKAIRDRARREEDARYRARPAAVMDAPGDSLDELEAELARSLDGYDSSIETSFPKLHMNRQR